MHPDHFRRTRKALGLTQQQLADRLKTTRRTIIRYEDGSRRVPGMAEVLLKHLSARAQIQMVGMVAAGQPLEPLPQMEVVEVPSTMLRRGETFALKVKGTSMTEEGILPGDIVVVRKQATARNGQTVVALINGEATIKKYYRKATRIELHPANAAMEPIVVTPDDEFRLEGILVGVIRHCE